MTKIADRITAWRRETLDLIELGHARQMYGARAKLSKRAPSNPALIKATKEQLKQARRMLQLKLPAHEIEETYARNGVRVTRNWLSRQKGAK